MVRALSYQWEKVECSSGNQGYGGREGLEDVVEEERSEEKNRKPYILG
jgi:hypothetical protein